MSRQKAACVILVFLFLLSGIASSAAMDRRLTVAAAADLIYALKEAAIMFERDTGVKVTISSGSSGMLAAQIEHGAPFDLFFAADIKYIEALKKSGYIVPDTVTHLAQGAITLAVNKRARTKVQTLEDLLKPEVKRVAVANPRHAPYGQAAVEALKNAGVWDRIAGKLVYGENIMQTLQFVQTGDATAGIVALSIANAREVDFFDIPPALYSPIDQGAGVVATSEEKGSAKEFLKFLNGPAGRAILKKYRFILPGKP